MQKVVRNYGIERNLGDIFYSSKTKSVFTTLDFGSLIGQVTLTLVKNKENGYDLLKGYKDKEGQIKTFEVGKLFAVKNKNDQIVEGLAKGSFGLFRSYDKDRQHDITQTNDCVILTSHKLKEPKQIKDGFIKVGYITGSFAVEIKSTNTNEANADEMVDNDDIPSDIIPF